MVFDSTISLGGLINILVIICGGIAFLVSMRATMMVLTSSVSGLSERVGEVERDLKALNQIIVTNAVNEEKITSIRSEITAFVQTYYINHQVLREEFNKRMNKLEEQIAKS